MVEDDRTSNRPELGRVWLRQRSKSWYWAAAFALVVVLSLLALFLIDLDPAAPVDAARRKASL